MDTPKTGIVTAAFREGNLIPVSTAVPMGEQTEGLTLLNQLISSFLGTTVGEFLEALPLPTPEAFRNGLQPLEDAENPLPNRRILLNNTTATTVKLPLKPRDGSRMAFVNIGSSATVTLNGNSTFIDPGDRTFSTTFAFPSTEGEFYEWFYRNDLAMWILLSTNATGTFTSLDSSPFPPELDSFLVTGLAIRLQSRFGNSPLPGTVEAFSRAEKNARARYAQTASKIVNPDLPISPRVA